MIAKSQILAEIRRTAAANGGAALGKMRFLTETGIKETDWSGKYWTRWSDALQEAGVAANEFNKPFDENELLEKFANLVLELGRLPITAEMQMKKRRDPDFPSVNVFRRFGTKTELIQKLIAFCNAKDQLIAVVRICDEATGRVIEVRREPEPAEVILGFVYLVKSGRHYKIGKSNASGRREYELAIQLPEKVKKVHEIRTDDPTSIEAYWHNRFKEKRKNGEWFDLTTQDVAAFKRRKFM